MRCKARTDARKLLRCKVKVKLTTRILGETIIPGENAETKPRLFISLADMVFSEMAHKERARTGSRNNSMSITSGGLKPREALMAFVSTVLMSDISGIIGCRVSGNFCISQILIRRINIQEI